MSNHKSNPTDAPGIDGQSPQLAGQFARLLAEHQRTIFLYLSTIQNGGQEVDDLFQETCVKCWEEFHNFQPGTNFGAWACTIAFNRARAWRKTRSRSKVVFSDKCLEMISAELIEHEQVCRLARLHFVSALRGFRTIIASCSVGDTTPRSPSNLCPSDWIDRQTRSTACSAEFDNLFTTAFKNELD